MANIGRTVTIKGDVTGEEDLYVEGTIDGRIELPQHHLIIGPNGEVRGEVVALQVTVVGTVDGNISATERIEVCETGVVYGDLTTPRLLILEGATFNGGITMVTKAPEVKRPAPMKVDRYEPADADASDDAEEPQEPVDDQPADTDEDDELADTEQLAAANIEMLGDTPGGSSRVGE